MPDPFQCIVVTPEAQVLDKQVQYASVPAWDGQLGVMSRRAPLLAKLGYGPLRLQTDSGEQSYFIAGGFVQVKDDVLTLLTDEARPVSELDRAEADAALEDALGQPAGSEREQEHKQQQLDRARAMVALTR